MYGQLLGGTPGLLALSLIREASLSFLPVRRLTRLFLAIICIALSLLVVF